MTEKQTTTTARQERPKIVIERTYPGRAEEMWALWTTKEGFESWWGPVGFRADVQAIEGRQDGALHYDMVADTPEMIEAMKQMGQPASHPTRARFSEYRPYDRLVVTSVIDFLPGVDPYDSVIEVDFFPKGEAVRMVVTLGPMHSDEFSGMQAEGFTSQLSKLDARFGVKAN
ncbi:MAG: SRPBCC domain-containing protein [Candidatus Sericytochromatia bacterium]